MPGFDWLMKLRDDPNMAKETVPTQGTNLSIISRRKRDGKEAEARDDCVVVRELGGTMVQLWPSFIEAQNTRV
ncbi:ADP-ribosylation factor 1 [Caligus rogercresseyi]|uniref:ADP-ribosylation factor 1 n=1 Tax=Caligus rogercresseyi TaxID=217165 RepID=A0A7T8K8E4_CALRO|nr:ADP-ribosylation factor 1 [Caligus rogercresseyi]